MERKGFVIFYLNFNEKNTLTVDEYVDIVRKQNMVIIQKLAEEGYESMFVPCFNESCRVEKVDIQNKGGA